MNYYNNPYNKYNRIKRNKYLDSLTKRFAVATLIFLLALLLKVTNYYNGSTLIFKVENYLNKDYTEYADRFMKDSDIIQTFSNKVLKKEQKSFSIEVMPVEGNIVRPFGEYVDAKTKKSFFNNGVDIEIKDDLNVRCVFDGKIEKVENTKDNGIVVTISHSGNYKTKYYNISELLKDIGEDVKKGDVIGQIDKEKNKTIHFEVLFNNNFVDPLKLMSTE